MATRSKRSARTAARSTRQYDRLATLVRRAIAISDRNASEIQKLRDEQRVQFKRSAQLQAELDSIKQAWERLKIGT